MKQVLTRINQRLSYSIFENDGQSSDVWKNPRSETYDRQWAEDALYHTIGPLTDNPTWANAQWSSKSQPVPGFVPGGKAPRWTEEEVVIAMAGDPSLIDIRSPRDNPRSPQYGLQGGSPLWRTAVRVAKYNGKDKNRETIVDLYSNGLSILTRLMKPGYDQNKSGFVSFTLRRIQGAMENGFGSTGEGNRAIGMKSQETGIIGLGTLLNVKTAEEAEEIANQVKNDFRFSKSHDKHDDNPFGPFSSRVYTVASGHADALRSGNQELIDQSKQAIEKLIADIEDEQTFIPGASTGISNAITTPDRKTRLKVGSMDVSNDESGGSMAGNIPSYEENDNSRINTETIFYALDIALGHDLTKWLDQDDLRQFVADRGLKEGENLGKLTCNEMRYLIRSLGDLGSSYPGKGKPRKATTIPRDAKNWWVPLEDPELEQLEDGRIWHSIWTRNDYPTMGPTEIAREMTEETKEFEQLGIATARKVKAKARGIEEVVSKVAVSKALGNATLKLQLILYSLRESLGIDESTKKSMRHDGFPLMEDFNPTDRMILLETISWMIKKAQHAIREGMAISSNTGATTRQSTQKTKSTKVEWSAK